MSITSKKSGSRKETRRTRDVKPAPDAKHIGLKEKNDAAERLIGLLKNPELLK